MINKSNIIKKRILVIDDEEDIREILQLSLQMSRGWEVLTAASGEQGLEIAVRTLPDAIILDVKMPGMDGPTTAQRLKQNPQTCNIPIIFLTAQLQGKDSSRYTELGVHAVLSKLIDPRNFAQQLSDLLKWR